MGQGIYFDSDKIEQELIRLSILTDNFSDDDLEWKKAISECQNLELGNLEKNITNRFQILNEFFIRKQNDLLKICDVYKKYENLNKQMVENLSNISLIAITDSRNVNQFPVGEWGGKIVPQVLLHSSMVIENWLYKYLIGQDE